MQTVKAQCELTGTLRMMQYKVYELTKNTNNASPARVGEVTSDAPFEEALTALAREHAVVFATGLVTTHHTVHHTGLVVISGLHVAASRLGRAILLIPPQVTLVPQPIGTPIGISPSPAHHGHRLVTEPLQ